MKIYGQDGSELMEVTAIERDGDRLLLKGKVFGTMPMTAQLRPEEVRNARKLIGWPAVAFILKSLWARRTTSAVQ